jgi:DNA-binding NarL/FixJ family response regulator
MDSEQKRQLCRVSASDSSFGPNGDAPQLRAGNREVHAVGGAGCAAVSRSSRKTNGSRISIVIADDHPITLAGLDALLAREADLRVLARCANAHEAVRAVSAYQPDILVLDQDLAVMDGMAIVKHLRRERRATRVVLLATSGTPHIHDAVHLGVEGLLYKNVDPRILVRCIREVHAGKCWIEPSLAGPSPEKPALVQALDGLTRRQNEVACAAVSGLSNKELAQRLGITEGTIKNHLHAIYERLQLDGRLALLLHLKAKELV